jgi:hypothetical protein
MTREEIHAAATQAGIPPEAFNHVTEQVLAHFADGPVKPADLTAYISALPVWTKVGLSQKDFYAMPPTWRAAQGWVHQPPAASRKPDSRILTAEELDGLKGLSWAEYYTRGRELQQTPRPQQPR